MVYENQEVVTKVNDKFLNENIGLTQKFLSLRVSRKKKEEIKND